SRADNPRPAIAPATNSAEANNTINWPPPNRGGSSRPPTLPPMALAWPPPPAAVVNHGNQALTDSVAANTATSQPGRSRVIAESSGRGEHRDERAQRGVDVALQRAGHQHADRPEQRRAAQVHVE